MRRIQVQAALLLTLLALVVGALTLVVNGVGAQRPANHATAPVAQTKGGGDVADKAPNPSKFLNPAPTGSQPDALGDTLFTINVATVTTPSSNSTIGAQYAQGFYWVTGRNTTDNIKRLWKLTTAGVQVAVYTQDTCAASTFGWRDLAYDGAFLWAADECGVDKIDPATGARVGGFANPTGVTIARSLAYDPALGQFYTANFNTAITVFDNTGAVIRTMPANGLSHYGFGWDAISPGGPYLWTWSQEGTGGAILRATRLNPTTGASTGVTFDGARIATTDISGGADVTGQLGNGTLTLVAVHQADANAIRGYDLAVPIVQGTPTPTITGTPPTATASRTSTSTAVASATPCAVSNYVSTDVPRTICDLCTITSTLTIPAGAGTIADLDLTGLSAAHTWISDMIVSLTSPSNTTVILVNRICGSEDNFTNITLDDQAASPIGSSCPPTPNGSFIPANPLSAFNGQSASGTWTLTISDNAAADTGNLTAWGLRVSRSGGCGTATSTVTGTPPTATPIATTTRTATSVATATPGGCLSSITQSTSLTPIAGSVACPTGDNHIYRAFPMASYIPSGSYGITSVDIGVEAATGTGGSQPITVTLYTSSANPPTLASLSAPLATTNITLTNQTLTLLNVPIAATVSSTSILVVEVASFAGGGNSFFIGSNAAGQSGPSYIRAAVCGATDITDLATLGFATMHVIMRVNGAGPCPVTVTVTPVGGTATRTATVGSTAIATATRTGTAVAGTSTPTATTAPTTCPVQFQDVPNGSTFYEFIRCLACRGIVNGYPCGGPGEPCPGNFFRPNNNVTRGQVSKIVSESAGFSNAIPSTQWTFQDVPPSGTFWLWVERLSGRGIIGGYPCGGAFEPCVAPGNRPYFRPNNDVTRGQLSKIVSGAAGWTETPTGQTFQDAPPGSTFYVFIERVASRGIVTGYPCGGVGEPCITPGNKPYFRPNNNATRGQMSKIAASAFFPGCSTPALAPRN